MRAPAGGGVASVALGLGLLLAVGSAAAVPPAAPPPCKLQTERDRIVEDYADGFRRSTRLTPQQLERMRNPIWREIPYQPSCLDLAMRWLVDEQSDDNRVAAASWLWQHRLVVHQSSLRIPVVSDVFGRLPTSVTEWRQLPLTPAVRRQWVERAANETHPIVLRVQLVHLGRGGFDADARAIIRGGLATVGKEVALAELAMSYWMQRGGPPLTRPERDLVWRMRHGGLSRQARFVLSRMRDPEWVAELELMLLRAEDQAALHEHASLAGLAPSFAPRVLADARAAIAQRQGECFFLRDLPRRLAGASRETLALAEVFLACKDKLSQPWDELIRAASLAPDADRALLALARLQRERGEPAFWRYSSKLIAALGSLRTDGAVDALLEVAHMCLGYGADGAMLWREAGAFASSLRAIGTPHAADGVVRLAHLTAGPCTDEGAACLWRIQRDLRGAIKAIGGPDEPRRLRELSRIRPLPKKKHPPRWTPPQIPPHPRRAGDGRRRRDRRASTARRWRWRRGGLPPDRRRAHRRAESRCAAHGDVV